MASTARTTIASALLGVLVALLANTQNASGQSAARLPQPGDLPTEATANSFNNAANITASQSSTAISGNPGAVNIHYGNGALGDALGVNRNGWRFGGLTINDANGILSGGLAPGKWAGQNLTIADLSFDTEKGGLWDGGSFCTSYLYYTGYGAGPVVNGVEQSQGSPNSLAGTVMGFNSLDNAPPINRSELYQLWYRQEMWDDTLNFRIGKLVPTFDFANVTHPVAMANASSNVPSTSGAILTPLYVNPTMKGLIPGYYNSASGVVVSYMPAERWYMRYGFFDGSLALGMQTGLEGPHFNGHYFHVGEIGRSWLIGDQEKPGSFGVGYWGQTGALRTFTSQTTDGNQATIGRGYVNGAQGFYFFASQRLYWENLGQDNNGLGCYFQFSTTDSEVQLTQRFFGCGLTYYGLLPNRSDDSCGFAMAYGQNNDNRNAGKAFYSGYGNGAVPIGPTEVILTWYYQINVGSGMFLQPNLTYIPNPAQIQGTPAAFPFTLQAVMLF